LSKKGKVIASVEGSVGLPAGAIGVQSPVDLHSLLAFSSGYVGEGATMAKEAAVLNRASVFVSPVEGLVPVEELCKNGKLLRTTTINKNVYDELSKSHQPEQMFDVTEIVVKEVSS
ncbi:MAG: DUF354 domain-containing protein, partial [Candidatus Peribacteraceae bacterium]|nr:DUF354 domain-containing protein [Candidatus Peribacteraceae bacterium]